jgi:hypothetical protein
MADLAASGLTPEQTALLMELSMTVAAEARPVVEGAAARRRERDRQYQADKRANRQSLPTSADSADAPPNDIYSNPPLPSSDEDGADEVSPEVKLWTTGKEFLVKLGVSKSKAGTVLGRWKRDRGIGETIEALAVADRESRLNGGLVDPIAFVEGVFRQRSTSGERPIC